MSRRRSSAAALPPAAMARVAGQWPGLADYIEQRRRRGIPAEGQRWARPAEDQDSWMHDGW